MKSVGEVEGGADTVLDAFIDYEGRWAFNIPAYMGADQ